ncbi:MAG: hypothetical protein V4793_44470, partial [Paraburkholderia tropica]
VRQALRSVGIDVTLRAFDLAAWTKNVFTDYTFDLVSSWGVNWQDPQIGVEQYFWSKAAVRGVAWQNAAGYASPEADRVIEAAQLTRGVLADLGLESFCKTSGGKGLHVIVPVVPGTSWDESKAFARAVSQRLASGWPTQFTATMGPAHRKKKVYVDYLRNARGASTAVAWGVRARPGMGVSVPIGWDELTQTTGGAHWSLADLDALRARMAQVRRADPWAAYAGVRQAVTSELTLRLEEGGA